MVVASFAIARGALAVIPDDTRSDPRERYSFLLEAAKQWSARLEESLEVLESARNGLVSDPRIADAISAADRIFLVSAAQKHLGAIANSELMVFDAAGAPIARLLTDANGRVKLDPISDELLASRYCRKHVILDEFVLHAQPWTALMAACEDEFGRYASTHVLSSAGAVRNRRGATVGAIEVIWGTAKLMEVLEAANRQLPAGCRLSVLNWDGALLDGITTTDVPTSLRPPIDSLPAIWTVTFDAESGLYIDGRKLTMLVLPIPSMSREGRWMTSILLCADPMVRFAAPTQGEASVERAVPFATLTTALVATFAVFGVGVWFVTRRALLRATIAANVATEEATLERNRLVSGVSHDIRGPLGAIMGYAELVRTDSEYATEGPLRANAFDAITRSCQFILRLTDHLLDLRSATMGRFAIEARFTDVLVICEECVNLYSIEAREKGLSIHLSHPNIERLQLLSDPTRIRQIVQNLVGNAVRYTERGSVALAVWVPDPTREEIEITVSDTGIGISAEGQAKIFAPFYQEKRPEGAPRAGTGLGLAVVKTIVTALGGSIEVRSEVGKGSVFVVRIPAPRWVDADESIPVREPLSVDGASSAAAASSLPLDGMAIAFADDYAAAREITSHVLRSAGARVNAFESGTDLVHAVQCGLQVDCVLLDLQMPGLSGQAAAELLRQSGYSGPLVALSALADEPTRKRSATSGFAEHVAKPTDASHLQAVIAKLVVQHRNAR